MPRPSKIKRLNSVIEAEGDGMGMEINLFGYPISCRGLAGDVAFACELITSGETGHYMACANPHSLVTASQDQIFADSLKNADILLPDGKGIEMAAWILNLPRVHRVAGLEFFCKLSQELHKGKGTRYFFLGSTNQVLKLITERLRKEFANIEVCGTLSPPYKTEFSEDESRQMISAVNGAQPVVLWVGMTAPKQEKWIYQNRNQLQVPFIGAIGAAFDYYAGTKERASLFWQRLGLEWLPRFVKEPKRLWKRYFISLPIYLYWVVREITRKR